MFRVMSALTRLLLECLSVRVAVHTSFAYSLPWLIWQLVAAVRVVVEVGCAAVVCAMYQPWFGTMAVFELLRLDCVANDGYPDLLVALGRRSNGAHTQRLCEHLERVRCVLDACATLMLMLPADVCALLA